MNRIYLDWAATAMPDENIIRTASERSFSVFANPSSPHRAGKDAAKLMEECRTSIAGTFGTKPSQIFFTSGGTDSNNIIFFSLLNRKRTGNIVISGIEHAAVYESAVMLEKFGWEIRIVNPEPDGIVSADKFCECIDDQTRLASLIMVNNETGSIQPVRQVGERIKADGRRTCHFHADAVQAAGKMPLSLGSMPVNSAAVSSHKFQGPRGTGILYLNREIEPIYAGGGQEGGIRNGTENTFGIVGTAEAAVKAAAGLDENAAKALRLKKILVENILEIEGAGFNPADTSVLLDTERYSPYILSVNIVPVPGEVLVRVMSDRGFDIATGSACATGKKKKSRVMTAMGINPNKAFSTVRISTGAATTEEEILQFCNTFKHESAILRKSLRH